MAAPVEETFRGNKITITVVTLLAVVFTALAYSVLSNPASRDFTTDLFFLVILALLAAALAWLFSLRVSIYSYGISKQTWFGSEQIRWYDIERFYYSATKRSVNFIPIGTYYSFKLVDREGNKIALTNSVERPSDLGQRLISSTFEPLYRKAAQLFDSGVAHQAQPRSGLEDQATIHEQGNPPEPGFGVSNRQGSFLYFQEG